MRSLFDDAAFVHHEDELGVADGAEAVCDDEAGAVGHQVFHGFAGRRRKRLTPEHFGTRVDRTGLFVEHGVVPAGQGADKVVGVGGLGGGDDFALGGGQLAVGDVVADGAVEQPKYTLRSGIPSPVETDGRFGGFASEWLKFFGT